MGLSEIMNSTSRDMIMSFIDSLVSWNNSFEFLQAKLGGFFLFSFRVFALSFQKLKKLDNLVKKLGERVLPEIIPILKEGLESEAPEKRQGVCVGLSEIMNSTSRDMIMSFIDSLVPTVQKALCDENADVRQAAARTFDSFHNMVGSKALDDILPALLEKLSGLLIKFY